MHASKQPLVSLTLVDAACWVVPLRGLEAAAGRKAILLLQCMRSIVRIEAPLYFSHSIHGQLNRVDGLVWQARVEQLACMHSTIKCRHILQ